MPDSSKNNKLIVTEKKVKLNNRARSSKKGLSFDDHIRMLVITSGITALSVAFTSSLFTSIDYVINPSDYAQAQDAPVERTPSTLPIPTGNNSQTPTPEIPNNSLTPQNETPPTPTPQTQTIIITGAGETSVSTPTTNQNTQQTPQSQALNSVQQNSTVETPRSGGIAFVSAGLITLALGAWYYYYNQYGDTKKILKMEEKKINTKI